MNTRGVVAATVAVFLCMVVSGEARTWTSQDGKEAVAEFVSLDGDTLTLRKGVKTFSAPMAGFSDEDQAFVREFVEREQIRLEKERARAEAERLDKYRALLGMRKDVAIKERRWADWKDYYLESICGKTMLKFFEKERSIVDVRDKGVFISAKDAVRPSNHAPTMVTYCPSDYDGKEALGVYIHISPGNKAVSPSGGYQRMMDKYRFVYASPFGAGNDQSDMRRCALALDALAQLRADFNVDESRVYIGGTSGGGAESTFATFLWPEDFRAAFNSVRSFTLESSSCLPFADSSDFRTSAKYHRPFAFISGPGDSNYSYMPQSEESFKNSGFVARFFDIPGMKHQMAKPETFESVLKWVEANKSR